MTVLMELSEVALDLPHGFFTERGGFDRLGCLLRLAHYPPLPPGREGDEAVAAGRSRYGAHTDL